MKFEYSITRSVATTPETTSIAKTIQMMVDRNISSILLHNDQKEITGILTERDVIRRVSLLDAREKLERAVYTVSTREVFFADEADLHESLVRLHFEKKIRHFPVLRGNRAILSKLVGMVTVTDVIRYFLALDIKTEQFQRMQAVHAHQQYNEPSRTFQLPVVCHTAGMMQSYIDAFTPIGITPYRIEDLEKFLAEHRDQQVPLVFDFDGYLNRILSGLIVKVTAYTGHLIMTTSNPGIVASFRPYLNKQHQTIAIKPLDVEYLQWLLFNKWRSINRDKAT